MTAAKTHPARLAYEFLCGAFCRRQYPAESGAWVDVLGEFGADVLLQASRQAATDFDAMPSASRVAAMARKLRQRERAVAEERNPTPRPDAGEPDERPPGDVFGDLAELWRNCPPRSRTDRIQALRGLSEMLGLGEQGRREWLDKLAAQQHADLSQEGPK